MPRNEFERWTDEAKTGWAGEPDDLLVMVQHADGSEPITLHGSLVDRLAREKRQRDGSAEEAPDAE